MRRHLFCCCYVADCGGFAVCALLSVSSSSVFLLLLRLVCSAERYGVQRCVDGCAAFEVAGVQHHFVGDEWHVEHVHAFAYLAERQGEFVLAYQRYVGAVGAVLDGLPAGEAIDLDQAQAFLRRRAPGQAHATARVESDIPHVLSGLTDGHTCGAPLCAVIENHGANSRDYDALRDIPRPMHADYPARVKFHGQADLRGGGVYSARLTAALCFAGAVCLQILARRGVRLGAHLLRVGEEEDASFDPLMTDPAVFNLLAARSPAVLDMQAGARMLSAIDAARDAGDSLGGAVREAPRIRRLLACFSVALFLFLTGQAVAAATLARHFGATAPAA